MPMQFAKVNEQGISISEHLMNLPRILNGWYQTIKRTKKKTNQKRGWMPRKKNWAPDKNKRHSKMNKTDKIRDGIVTDIKAETEKLSSHLCNMQIEVITYKEEGKIVVGVDIISHNLTKEIIEKIKTILSRKCEEIEQVEDSIIPQSEGVRMYAIAKNEPNDNHPRRE